MSDIFNSSIIQFHSKEDGFNLYDQSTSGSSELSYNKFGVLSLEMIASEMTVEKQYIHSSNDMSGSMSDICNDGRTKMQHLKLTLENIVTLLSKNANKIDVDLEITGFDTKIEEVLNFTRIAEDSKQLMEIHNKIKSVLLARGCTDIGIALNDAASKLKTQNISEKSFIFMTDGIITQGTTNIEILKEALPEKSQNYFIGFGSDHDFKLLQELSTVNMGTYYYVDKIENAGLVFGEIIHSILYTISKNNIITVNNGEIYDFQRNEWVTELKIQNLCAESKKDFHVRSKTPETFSINISGVTKDSEYNYNEQTLPSLINEDNTIEPVDLRKYMYRQKTLELLATSITIAKNKYSTYQEKISHQEALKDLRNELQTFAKEFVNDADTTAYIKQLCDDLYISDATLHSDKSLLYTTARRTTQGRGGSYNITQLEKCDIQRQNAFTGFNDDEDYHVNEDPVSRFASDTQVEVMRSCSLAGYNDEETESEQTQVQENVFNLQRSNAIYTEEY